jgi:hypothetical protein
MDDREAIRQLKARYCRFMDTKDWDSLQSVFTDDATVGSYGENKDAVDLVGAAPIVEFLRSRLGELPTMHQCFAPEIDLVSATGATGIWATEHTMWTERGSVVGYGHYHDTFQKVGDTWLIKSVALQHVYLEHPQGTAAASNP